MTRQTANYSKLFRIAYNRGRPRVWIEGKFLTVSGISTGMRFDRTFDDGAMILTFGPTGKHKVSGTTARPIIDLNGAYLIDLFKLNEKIEADRATHYRATIYQTVAFEENSLTIYIEGEIL